MPNFMKIRLVGAEFFSMRKDGQTYMTYLVVRLRNFANAPRISLGVSRKIWIVLKTRIKSPWISTEVYLQNEQLPAVFPSRPQRIQPLPRPLSPSIS